MSSHAVSQARWERIATLSGIGFAVLLGLRTLITPRIPIADGESAVAAFFVAHQSVWLATVFMTGLIVLAGTWFYGGLHAVLTRAGEGRLATVAFGGWVMVGAVALVRHALLAVPALLPLDLATTTLLVVAAAIMLSMVWLAAFVATAAIAVAATRSGALPSWCIAATVAFAMLTLAGGLTLLKVNGYFSPTGDFKTLVVWGYVVWASLVSLAMFAQFGTAASPEVPVA